MSPKSNDGYLLDILFILDATASMEPYIEEAKERIVEICTVLRISGRLRQHDGLKMGLLAYRDYPEKETEFIVKAHSFTFNVHDIKEQLKDLDTKRNRDVAEAFRTALHHALTEMQGWRKEAVKVVIVVTDAAPHGIKEDLKKDNYPDIGPEDVLSDPLKLAASKADENYSIIILACEPTLSQQSEYAIDFYKALADLSRGAYLPLTDHRALSTLILGSVLEKVDLRSLSDRYREEILKRFLTDGAPVETVINELHEKLKNEGEQVMSVGASNPYNDSDAAIHNYKAFLNADTLKDARKSLKPLLTHRINRRAEQKIEAKRNETNTFEEVDIHFINRGDYSVTMWHYNDQLEPLKKVTIKEGLTYTTKCKINVASNFVFDSGSITKTISRFFNRKEIISVHSMFE